MKYGLSTQQLQILHDVFTQYPDIEQVILFGSRAIDTYKEASDVDLALKGTIDTSLIAHLQDTLEEDTDIPFFFDVLAYDDIQNQALRHHINKKGVILYRKGWQEVKLGEIVEVIGGGTPKTSNPKYWNGDIPWLTPRDLSGYSKIYIEHGARSISQSGLKNSSAKLIPKGTVLLTSRAPIGYLAIAKNKISTNQGFKSLVVNANLTFNIFIYYWLKWNVNYLQLIGTGSTFAEISGSTVKELRIYLPPLTEQKAIAEVLSSLDDKIDLFHRQNKTLQAIAETLFRQWFIEEAQEEWEEKPLGTLFDVKIGRTPPRKEKQWFSSKKYDLKWISIKDLGNASAYINNVSEYLTLEAAERFHIPIIPENTVLLSFKLTVGRVAITTEKMLSNEAIAHFKARKETIFFPEYLYLFLKSINYDRLGSTSSIAKAINSQIIKKIIMPIPDLKKLERFKKICQSNFKKIKANSAQIRTLTSLRDTLLPKLMSGHVRIKPLLSIKKRQ